MTKIVVLVHCDTVIYNKLQSLRVLSKFVPNKFSGQLLDASPNFTYFQNILI